MQKPRGLRWIRKSTSTYSSPVVYVRKKDFRVLNRKTVPNYHALPCIQDLPDKLRGYSWFSILDQVSAYHRGMLMGPPGTCLLLAPLGVHMSGFASNLSLLVPQRPFNNVRRGSLTELGMSVLHISMMCSVFLGHSRIMESISEEYSSPLGAWHEITPKEVGTFQVTSERYRVPGDKWRGPART